MPPDAAPALDPEVICTLPERLPLLVESGEPIEMFPLPDSTEPPEANVMEPPKFSSPKPAESTRSPPYREPGPTESEILPESPFVASPVKIITFPLWPSVELPEAKVTFPLIPAMPASAVAKESAPLVVVAELPLLTWTDPPATFNASPPSMETCPPRSMLCERPCAVPPLIEMTPPRPPYFSLVLSPDPPSSVMFPPNPLKAVMFPATKSIVPPWVLTGPTPEPTFSLMLPPLPAAKLEPVDKTSSPLVPKVALPERRAIPPLVPESPALAVEIAT
mmetsp:Transcript_19027/g.33870  ORF Transcript_19027/g.33870 Transcript_19027/m.33870 type:complete len:277 (-) Transcript_19027:6718-7548(-)